MTMHIKPTGMSSVKRVFSRGPKVVVHSGLVSSLRVITISVSVTEMNTMRFSQAAKDGYHTHRLMFKELSHCITFLSSGGHGMLTRSTKRAIVCRKRLFQRSLCLSRACLRKLIVSIRIWLKKAVSLPVQR
jgi:hypothetical protein